MSYIMSYSSQLLLLFVTPKVYLNTQLISAYWCSESCFLAYRMANRLSGGTLQGLQRTEGKG